MIKSIGCPDKESAKTRQPYRSNVQQRKASILAVFAIKSTDILTAYQSQVIEAARD
jgi:hypothetical protein